MSINPMDMFSAELQQLLVSHVASHDKLTATNVNQQWRGIFLQETNARNAKAMDKFMLNPASYLPEGSSPAVLDSKLQDFSPLLAKLMRSILVQLMYNLLGLLGFDTLGNPKAGSETRTIRLPLDPKVAEAIKAFQPELIWLQAHRIPLQLDSRSNDITDAYFPIINSIRTGDLEHLKPVVDYMYTEDFADAANRSVTSWVPESYVNFLIILMFGANPRTEPLTGIAQINEQRDFHMASEIRRGIRNTLAQAAAFLATQAGSLQRFIEIAKLTHQFDFPSGEAEPFILAEADRNMIALTAILQENVVMANEILNSAHPGLHRQVLGFCAVKLGLTTNDHLPEDWKNPTDELLQTELYKGLGIPDRACNSKFYRHHSPIALQQDGRIILSYFPLNDSPTALAMPGDWSDEADIDMPINPANMPALPAIMPENPADVA